jgi:hypothetical protein
MSQFLEFMIITNGTDIFLSGQEINQSESQKTVLTISPTEIILLAFFFFGDAT